MSQIVAIGKVGSPIRPIGELFKGSPGAHMELVELADRESMTVAGATTRIELRRPGGVERLGWREVQRLPLLAPLLRGLLLHGEFACRSR